MDSMEILGVGGQVVIVIVSVNELQTEVTRHTAQPFSHFLLHVHFYSLFR